MALASDETQYENVCKEQFKKILDRLDEIHGKLFVGNGQPAMNVRLDRLEQSHKASTKAFWIAITALIVVMIGAVWDLVSKGGK